MNKANLGSITSNILPFLENRTVDIPGWQRSNVRRILVFYLEMNILCEKKTGSTQRQIFVLLDNEAKIFFISFFNRCFCWSQKIFCRTRMYVCCVLAVNFDLRLDVKLIYNLFIINLHTGGTIWRPSELLLFVLLRLLKLPSNSLNSVCSLDR